jgi:hypothetical protein
MKQNCIVVDIDNTVADNEHRVHNISGVIKDWKKFFSECGFDKPISRNIKAITHLYYLTKIQVPDIRLIFLTGRPESVKGITHVWLNNHFPDLKFDLICRHDELWVPNFEFKRLAVTELDKVYNVCCYIDDDHESCKAVKPYVKDGYVLTVV